MSDEQDLLPQYDRGKIKTPVGFYHALLRLHDMERECVLPAIVREYDRKTGIARVSPLVNRIGESVDGEEVEMLRADVSVKVVRFAHGGFVIDAPLFKGDTGWLVACDRNASTAIEKNSSVLEGDDEEGALNEGPKKPDDCEIGRFQNGLFIPSSWASVDHEGAGLYIESVAGGTITVSCGESKFSIGEDGIAASSGECSASVGSGAAKASVGTMSVSIEGRTISARNGEGASAELSEDSATVKASGNEARISKDSAYVKFGGDSLSIDGSGIHYSGKIDYYKNRLTDLRYDPVTHQLQKRMVLEGFRGDIAVRHGPETGWIRIDNGTAVPERPCFCGA